MGEINFITDYFLIYKLFYKLNCPIVFCKSNQFSKTFHVAAAAALAELAAFTNCCNTCAQSLDATT